MRLRNTTGCCALELFALGLLSVLGCGGEKSPPSEPAPEPAAAPLAQPAAPAPTTPTPEPAKPDAAGIVHISGSDLMRFSATQIEVSAGQKIKIEMKNAGALPKEVMGHDLIVLKTGADVTAFATKAMSAKATDYIPPDAADQMLAHTKLLGPGETETIEFDAPAPGSYPYLCSFPGHVGLMNGMLVVK